MFGFFSPAPAIPRLPKDKVSSAYKAYRIRMFLMIFIGYTGYYLVRKNFAVASPYLIDNYGFSKTQIGLIRQIKRKEIYMFWTYCIISIKCSNGICSYSSNILNTYGI